MLDLLNKIPGQFPFAIQMFIAGVLFSVNIKKRGYPIVRLLAVAAAFLTIGWFIPDLLLAGFFFVPFFVLTPIAVLGFAFVLDADAKQIFLLVVNTVLLQHIAECTTGIVRGLLDVTEGSLLWMLSSLICYVPVYLAAYFLLVFKKDTSIANMKSWKMIFIGAGTYLIIYCMRELIFYLIEQRAIYLNIVTIAINLYSAVACLLVFIVFYSFNHSDALFVEKQILQELLRKEQDTYALISANLDNINYKCHDLKHQIAFLRDTGGSEAREEYIKKLERDVMIYERTPKTGNVALDTTLANKCMYCEQNEIEFVFLADAKALDFMEPTDIYSLVGNALDNAVECVLKYGDVEKRQISMRVSGVGNMLRIYIENYCEDPPNIKNGEIVTSKADKLRHGFGLKSIRYIVEKYGGYMNMEQRDKLFVLTILFPLSMGGGTINKFSRSKRPLPRSSAATAFFL